jgi:hypothetical protein
MIRVTSVTLVTLIWNSSQFQTSDAVRAQEPKKMVVSLETRFLVFKLIIKVTKGTKGTPSLYVKYAGEASTVFLPKTSRRHTRVTLNGGNPNHYLSNVQSCC